MGFRLNQSNEKGILKRRSHSLKLLIFCSMVFILLLMRTPIQQTSALKDTEQVISEFNANSDYIVKYEEIGGLDYCNGSLIDIIIENDHCYTITDGGVLSIFSLSDFSSIQLVLQMNLFDSCYSICLFDNILYISLESGIRALDVTNAAYPTKLYDFALVEHLIDIITDGNYLYGINPDQGLFIIDITNPYRPWIRVQYYSDSYGADQCNGIEIKGNYVYITDPTAGLEIIDVSNIDEPVEVHELTLLTASSIHMHNDLLFVFVHDQIKFINIANPLTATIVSSYLIDTADQFYAEGDLLYIPFN